MARISKTEHPRILKMVQDEHRKVADVAAEYGCTPATIYNLLNKHRRESPPSPKVAPPPASTPTQPDKPVAAHEPQRSTAPATPVAAPAADLFAAAGQAAAPALTREATVTNLAPRGEVKKGRGLGASLAKPGFGLVMRTPEGDESLTPFRSLEDLLSAVKPILRAAARSPDAVWFSIQSVDLASLDSDAA